MARREQELSRLALSVVYGTLQLLVPASSGNLGQTFLRRRRGPDDGACANAHFLFESGT